MKEIIYVKNNKTKKTIKLPWKFTNKTLTTDMESRTNPFSGESIELPNFAAEVYDVTMQFNHRAEEYDQKHGMGAAESLWPQVRKGLDWFRQHFPKQYMVLLD